MSQVIIYYDHTITLSDEVSLIWRAPLSKISLIFLVNRYFAFFTVRSVVCVMTQGTHRLLRPALPFLLSQFFKLSEEVCADVAP